MIHGNYHSHTYRCKHATGDVADYVEEALKTDLKEIGISDHTPLPDGRWSGIRMAMDELNEYITAIEEAQQRYPEISVLKGMECEYMKSYENFYKDELLCQHNFDYLIGSVHFIPKNEEWYPIHGLDSKDLTLYAQYMIESMESGLFAFIAHPDLFCLQTPTWNEDSVACSKDIFSAAASLGIPLEINGSGLRKPKIETSAGELSPYPYRPFWEIATDYPIKVICNSDAHDPEFINSNRSDAYDLAIDFGFDFMDVKLLKQQAYRK